MSEKKISRYVRQEIFAGIGSAGQAKLLQSRVVIMGLSGLGTATAESLARAGVGFIRIVDGDFADIVELQRQNIFTESDACFLSSTFSIMIFNSFLRQNNRISGSFSPAVLLRTDSGCRSDHSQDSRRLLR